MKKTTVRSVPRLCRPSRLGRTLMSLAAIAALSACNTKDNDGYDIPAVVQPTQGRLVDAPVEGVSYQATPSAISGKTGLLEGNAAQVLTQIWGITATIIWCAVATFVILVIVNILVGVRVSLAAEVEGLDINLHGEVVP